MEIYLYWNVIFKGQRKTMIGEFLKWKNVAYAIKKSKINRTSNQMEHAANAMKNCIWTKMLKSKFSVF